MSAPYPGFSVGNVRVETPLLLAPMEDVSNVAMRRVTHAIARPGLMFTEFVSAMAVHYNAQKTIRKMRIHPDERPLAIQIFGGDPATMAEAAQLAEQSGADIVDINMGCWVPKVCRTGAGAALLKDPDTAEAIVKAVVNSVKVPVTVKVRAGWDYSLFAAPDLARRFQDAGAQMLTLHARFAKQGFEGEADWSLIRDLRGAVQVPLIGNGDVKTPFDARKMLDETGANGVMVGRAAISDPWTLAWIRTGIVGDPVPREEFAWPTLAERIAVARQHAQWMVAYECGVDEFADAQANPEFAASELRAVRALRGQLPLYVKGEPGASQIRARVTQCNTLAELDEILLGYLAEREAAVLVH